MKKLFIISMVALSISANCQPWFENKKYIVADETAQTTTKNKIVIICTNDSINKMLTKLRFVKYFKSQYSTTYSFSLNQSKSLKTFFNKINK